MKRIAVIICAFIALQIFLALRPQEMPQPKNKLSEAEILGSLRTQEAQSKSYGRDSRRRSAIKALTKSWSSFCDRTERPQLISSLKEYFYHRRNEVDRTFDTYGAVGAKFIAEQYNSPDDRQIDSMLRDGFRGRYINLNDFSQFEQKVVADIVKTVQVSGKGCA